MTREVKTASDPKSSALSGQIAADTAASGGASVAEQRVGLHQIGQVADRVGVSLRTVRYYEEQGLLVPETRTSGGFRLYSDDQIERLELIKQMKPLGFTVEETRALLEARDALHNRSAPSDEREAATASLRDFAAAAAQRCEELSLALERASELARRLRHEAREAGGACVSPGAARAPARVSRGAARAPARVSRGAAGAGDPGSK
jgi:MerR family transcriptional regulator, copper efflux regulator